MTIKATVTISIAASEKVQNLVSEMRSVHDAGEEYKKTLSPKYTQARPPYQNLFDGIGGLSADMDTQAITGRKKLSEAMKGWKPSGDMTFGLQSAKDGDVTYWYQQNFVK